MLKKYTVLLTDEQEKALIELVTRGRANARTIRRAHTLLLAWEGLTDERIAEAMHCCVETVAKTRKRFTDRGLGSLYDRPRPGAEPKLNGHAEAQLVAIACTQAPDGHGHWTMQLLADKLVALRVVDSVSDETVRRVLKKQKIKPWLTEQWCIGELNAEFLARMEELLDLYERPYNPTEPVVCFDECPVQLLGEVHEALPAEPGQPRRQDYEYIRAGTACLLACVEPCAGWRDVEVSDRRTKVDFARRMKYLVTERYPDASVIHVVLDNLNTHTMGALYEAFSPAEARQIARKLRFHFTPVHGSWLNMTEIELSVISRDCLSKRLPTIEALRADVNACQQRRNHDQATINWRFTVDHARDKFHRFYPN